MPDVIVAALDCADTIGSAVRAFRTVGQVIVVDCGSVDGTADKAHMNGAVVVNGKGLDKGHAISLGLRHVSTPRTILVDADIHGYEPAHASAMAEEFDGMVRGRVTGLFPMRSGPLSHRTLAPCLSAIRSLPTDLARGIELSGLAFNTQLNFAATLCGLKTKFVSLDGLSPDMDRQFYDYSLYSEWAGAVISGEVTIPNAKPEILRAVRRLGWLTEAGG